MLVAKHNLSLAPALIFSSNNHLYLLSAKVVGKLQCFVIKHENWDQLMEELNPEYWSIYFQSKMEMRDICHLWDKMNDLAQISLRVPLAILTEIVFVLQPLSWDRGEWGECFNEEVGWDCLVRREGEKFVQRQRAACFRCKRIFVSRDQAGKLSWNIVPTPARVSAFYIQSDRVHWW